MLWKKLGEAEPLRSPLSRDVVGSENLGVQGLDGCPGLSAAPSGHSALCWAPSWATTLGTGALQVDGIRRDLRGGQVENSR